MGHGNMLLAVAGLNDNEIKVRTKRLAVGDWDGFAPAERQAYAFAAQLSSRPGTIGEGDVKDLVATFGPERAIDVIWYTAWVNFMTRVADSFQFPLERDNVFAPPVTKTPGTKSADESKR